MLAKGIEITEYIPQRNPFVMIDTLFYADEIKSVSGFLILPDNVMVEDGFLSENALVENIAQTAAAGIGYDCKKRNVEVPIGYIAAIKDLNIITLPAVGDIINTEVIVTNQVLNISVVKGIVKHNDNIIANCEMRIFIKE